MPTQMYCGVVIISVLCFCLVGFTASKCDPEECGSMKVSYPFWINKSECGYPDFQIYCNKVDEDNGTMALFLPVDVGNDNIIENLKRAYYKIWDIDYSGHIVINSTSLKASSCRQSEEVDTFKWFRSPGPFYFSMSDKFVVVGCNITGNYTYGKTAGQARCVSSCYSQKDPAYCYYGCCEITVPDNYWWIQFSTGEEMDSFNDEVCGFSTVMDPSTFKVVDDKSELFPTEGINAYYGLRLNWGIGLSNCSMAKNTANYSCSSNAECIDSPSRKGHVCKCRPGYEGYGYSNGTGCTDRDECSDKNSNMCVGAEGGGICLNLPGSYDCSCAKGYEGDGYVKGTSCKDVDECRQRKRNMCVEDKEGGICQNLPGSYNCSCATGYKGDGFLNGTKCKPEKSNKTVMFAAIGSVSASASLGACVLVWWVRKRYQKHASEENFRCNGGFLLQEILAEGQQAEGKIFRIFPENELKKASNNYSQNMKLGGGRSSTVYRGILSDGTNVAIKKFKEFPIGVESDASRKQFIKEIVNLSGLIHENVVRLVGCCLQTQSPVLVYKFVDGGTVSHQLRSGHLTWQRRLQIAMGTAEALAYLHSELNHRPIIHRDVKSSNILLDNGVTPKVANFGLSWILCENDTHLKTNVKDTSGYMDPEYFRKGKLTDKSDVYSFGVFLAELLTGREALSTERPQEEMLLSQFFLTKCKDNCFIGILDPDLKNGENWDQMTAVASLAKECLCPEGNGRPSMVDIKTKLEEIGGSTRLSTTTSDLNVLSNQISSATPTGSTDSLCQLTELSRMHGR